ncbi:MAG: hypothetical protein LPK02_07520 [Rhodobacterales bacterium]|nr:hypothetical protein [Rhodobacterales bacterium]
MALTGKSIYRAWLDEWCDMPISTKWAEIPDTRPSFVIPKHLASAPSNAEIVWPKRVGKTAAMEKMASETFKEEFKAVATSSVKNPCSEIPIELEKTSFELERLAEQVRLLNTALKHRISTDIIKGSMWAQPKPEPERGELWGSW